MTASPASLWIIWGIVAAATAGVIIRPLAWPEFIWATLGALLLVGLGLLSLPDAISGVLKGADVYLFLIGMMLLSELAREEGLFDWMAAHAAGLAHGSATRLFSLVFALGAIVTVFLSNDATAVVLTPAVAAIAKAADAKDPLPFLLICAFIANAASFVLPISNPANLVIYASHMPPLLHWLPRYALPSALSIGATYAALRWTQRRALQQTISTSVPPPPLSAAGKLAALGIAATAIVLLACSGLGVQLGLPTLLAGLATAALVLTGSRSGPLPTARTIVRNISWGVLPLVAGLFVLVEALQATGVTGRLAAVLQTAAQGSATATAWLVGAALALGCNAVNNLPAGLLAGRIASLAQMPEQLRSAILIGVDLGPNLSVTGSLATILWLTALKREGHTVSAWTFLKLGAIVMPPALLLALAATLLFGLA